MAMHESLASSMSGKLVKSLRKHLQNLHRHLDARFVTAFEEDAKGVRRPWTSNLADDAKAARAEVAKVLAQLALVPAGLHVPGVDEKQLKTAQVRSHCARAAAAVACTARSGCLSWFAQADCTGSQV